MEAIPALVSTTALALVSFASVTSSAAVATAAPRSVSRVQDDVRSVVLEKIAESDVPTWWNDRVRSETLGGIEVRLVPGTDTGDTAEAAVATAQDAAREAATDLLFDALCRWLGLDPAEVRRGGTKSEEGAPEWRLGLEGALRHVAASHLEGANFLREDSVAGRSLEHLADGSRREGTYHRGWVMLRVPYAAFTFDEAPVLATADALREDLQPAPAIALLRVLVDREPARYDLLRRLADLQRWAGRSEDAAATFRLALDRAPDDATRTEIEAIVRELEEETARGPWESFVGRIETLLERHATGMHLRLRAMAEEADAGGTLLYTAWSRRAFAYWGLDIARDGVSLRPFLDEADDTQLGDERSSESFTLDVGTVLGGHRMVLLAAPEPRPWFRPAWYDRAVFEGDRTDEAIAAAIDEAQSFLDLLERELAANEVHAAWMEYRVVP